MIVDYFYHALLLLLGVLDDLLIGHGHLLGELDHHHGLVTDNLGGVARLALVGLASLDSDFTAALVLDEELTLLQVAEMAARALLRGVGNVGANALNPLPSGLTLDAHARLVANVDLGNLGLGHLSDSARGPVCNEK